MTQSGIFRKIPDLKVIYLDALKKTENMYYHYTLVDVLGVLNSS